DFPVGALLSGGLDSSLITAIAAEQLPGLPTFTISFEDARYDEAAWAAQAASSVGVPNTLVTVSQAEQARCFADALFHAEHYVQQTDGVAKLLVAEVARRETKCVLVGEGADEVFLGYPSFLLGADGTRPGWDLSERARRHTTRPGLDFVGTGGVPRRRAAPGGGGGPHPPGTGPHP